LRRPQPAARKRADQEGARRDQRRGNRQVLRARDRKAEKDDVAGHVRDEHVTERQIAHGVDEPGQHRQHE